MEMEHAPGASYPHPRHSLDHSGKVGELCSSIVAGDLLASNRA
jgi:hypothetical protein